MEVVMVTLVGTQAEFRDALKELIELEYNTIESYTAAIKTREMKIGFLPICQSDRLSGVVTDRDIVLRGVAEGLADNACIAEIMTDKVIYCYENEFLEDAVFNMGKKCVRRLAVLNPDKRLVGVLSLDDIAQS